MKTFVSVLAALTLATAAPALAAEPSRLTLTFETGVSTGAVMVALFDSEAAWSGSAPVRAVRLDVSAGQRTITFDDLPAGDYGMKAFHDVNGDGEMNTNPFGMPIEPYAFSNNAVGNMGPARWEQARFTVTGTAAQTISIR
tara:strand:- start:4183 stop:4605 length:423 start_codon:yes stop_codon:yes gene_type:complete